MVYSEQIAKKNMVVLEEVFFLSNYFSIGLKSLPEVQSLAADEWVMVE